MENLENVKHEKLTPEKLRKYKGFKNINDTIAHKIIHELELLAEIVINTFN